MTDNENKEKGKEEKGVWNRFMALSYDRRFLIIFGAVIALFGLAILILALTLGEDMNWYGFIIGAAIVLCVVWGQYACVKQGYYSDMVFDYVIFAVPCAFGGGVLYYGFFNNFDFGGIAVLGALIGAGIGLILAKLVYRYAFKNKPSVSLLQMLDLASVFILLGQAIGRIGCYFAHPQCCYGIPVDFDVFPFSYVVNSCPNHPGQLHLGNPFIESIWCAIGFIPMVIMYLSRRKSFNGFYISLYCIWYGVERFVLEFFRDPAQKLTAAGGFGESFGASQVVSLLMIAFGIIWIAQYIVRALLAGKKIMILVPKDKLSDEYFGYKNTIYARPHGDGNGNPIDYTAPVSEPEETDGEGK